MHRVARALQQENTTYSTELTSCEMSPWKSMVMFVTPRTRKYAACTAKFTGTHVGLLLGELSEYGMFVPPSEFVELKCVNLPMWNSP